MHSHTMLFYIHHWDATKDAANALKVLFDHWKKIGIPDILATDNANELIEELKKLFAAFTMQKLIQVRLTLRG